MKKLLIAVLLFASTGVMAQKFQLGLKGGVNFANFTGVPIQNVSKSTYATFLAGGFINLKAGDNFSIQPEVLFATQGVSLDSNGLKTKYKINYLAVPVMAKFEFNSGFFVEAGPQFSFKLSEDVPNSSIDNFAKNVELSLAGGLGYHGKSGFGVGGRYVAGISKVGNYSRTSLRNPDFRNSAIQLYAFLTLFNNRK